MKIETIVLTDFLRKLTAACSLVLDFRSGKTTFCYQPYQLIQIIEKKYIFF